MSNPDRVASVVLLDIISLLKCAQSQRWIYDIGTWATVGRGKGLSDSGETEWFE